jgi:hypothetical protein
MWVFLEGPSFEISYFLEPLSWAVVNQDVQANEVLQIRVNSGQDGDLENDPTQNPDHDIARVMDQRQAEVEEIQAIEREGSFGQLADGTSVVPSVLDAEIAAAEGAHRVGPASGSTDQDIEAQYELPSIHLSCYVLLAHLSLSHCIACTNVFATISDTDMLAKVFLGGLGKDKVSILTEDLKQLNQLLLGSRGWKRSWISPLLQF